MNKKMNDVDTSSTAHRNNNSHLPAGEPDHLAEGLSVLVRELCFETEVPTSQTGPPIAEMKKSANHVVRNGPCPAQHCSC